GGRVADLRSASVRRTLVSLLVGVLGAAAVAAAGWGVQTLGLSALPPAARVGADAEAWVHYYPFSIDVFHFEDHRAGGACVHGWRLRPRPHSGDEQRGVSLWPGSVLALAGGPIVLAS